MELGEVVEGMRMAAARMGQPSVEEKRKSKKKREEQLAPPRLRLSEKEP